MEKPSILFEGENSSLRKTFDEATKDNSIEAKIREEFLHHFTVWNDKYKFATLTGKEEYPTPEMIADWWLAKIKELKLQILEEDMERLRGNIQENLETQQDEPSEAVGYRQALAEEILHKLQEIDKIKKI